METSEEYCRRIERVSQGLTSACRKLENLSYLLDELDEGKIVAIRLYRLDDDSSGGYHLDGFSSDVQKTVRNEVVAKMHALENAIEDLKKGLA